MVIYWFKKCFFVVKNTFFGVKSIIGNQGVSQNDETQNSRFLH